MPHHAQIAEPFVLEDKVVTLHDEAWIADHTELYINWVHDLSEQEIVEITDEIYRRTGFKIHGTRTTMTAELRVVNFGEHVRNRLYGRAYSQFCQSA